jgi:DNA-binding SARP family transcriptional activator
MRSGSQAGVRQTVFLLEPDPDGPLLRLLGGFHLSFGGRDVGLPLMAQRVSAFLAVRQRPVSRECIAGSLWPDARNDRAHANLRSALWRLRVASPRLVQATRTELTLNPRVRVDLHELAMVARRLHDQPLDKSSARALSGWLTGELLPDWYDDWVLLERERARQLRLHALESLCQRLIDAGWCDEAVLVALATVAEEPLRESAQRLLISAHLAEGNASEALRQYRSYRDLLWRDLGIRPSSRVEELVGGIGVGSR